LPGVFLIRAQRFYVSYIGLTNDFGFTLNEHLNLLFAIINLIMCSTSSYFDNVHDFDNVHNFDDHEIENGHDFNN